MNQEQEFQELIEGLFQNIKLLEQSVIKTVVDSKTENELILRELTGYLNSTANEVRQLNNIISQIANATSLFNNASMKLDDIENKTIEMPQKFLEFQSKIGEFLKNMTDRTNKNDAAIYQGLQNVSRKTDLNTSEIQNMKAEITKFSEILKNISENIAKNQENTNYIIQKLVDGNLDITKSKITVESENKKIEAENKKEISAVEADIKKTKMDLITKVILALIGSGGLIYFIVTKLFT